MTYTETLEYLLSRLPMFSRTGPAAIKPNLDNTYAICKWLGDPQQKFRSIHIAGTNGKGSCSHMLAAILQASGYKTGLYTSPHLHDFRERIKINGEMIEKDFVVRFTSELMPLIEQIDPSFFEVTVGMAFAWFAHQQVDVAVIETGLGGRLDSTNVIMPELSVITNIGLDHTNLLGTTLTEIAAEKAGIIKPGIPVVIGESSPATDIVFTDAAARNDAPMVYADKAWNAVQWHQEVDFLSVELQQVQDGDRISFQLDLPGIYQLKNLITVMAAVQELRKKRFVLPENKVTAALTQVRKMTGLHGRWETIHRHPAIVLDVAHNEDGIRQLTAQIALSDYDALHIVIGMVRDKEVDKALSLLPREAHYYFTQAQIPRALPAAQLQEKAGALGLAGRFYPEVNAALRAAREQAAKEDLILVCGSIFLVAEVNVQ